MRDPARARARVLVTGGAGFIGSHLVDRLAARGDEVMILDDLSTGRALNLAAWESSPAVRLVVGSTLDDALVGALVAESDEVFHLAGAVGVGLVLSDPIRTIESIVEGARVVLRHAARRGCRVLVASSSEIYGPEARGPLSERDRPVLGPPSVQRWAYAAAKLTSEHLALAHHTGSGLPVTVARFFNTVGPRQSGAYGMVLPRFVAQALEGGPLTIHGDGRQTRSFADVRDVCDALLQLARSEGAIGRVVNVGGDQPISIRELAQRVQDVLRVSVATSLIPHEAAFGPGFEDVRARVPDLSLLAELIDRVPTRPLEETIADLAAERRGAECSAARAAVG